MKSSYINCLVLCRPDRWVIVRNVPVGWSGWPQVDLALESGHLIF